jgi:hypothetical protein
VKLGYLGADELDDPQAVEEAFGLFVWNKL